MKKVCLFFILLLNVWGNDILEDINLNQKQKNKIINTVWNSNESKFLEYRLSLVDTKLKLNNNGNIIMFISDDFMNIDENNIFKYIKFDTTLDKETIYNCEFQNNENSEYCDHKFYTVEAGSDFGGIFNLGKSLLEGRVAVDKKFDRYEFAKTILSNEDFIKQLVKKIITTRFIQNKPNQINSVLTNHDHNNFQCITEWVKSGTERIEPPSYLKLLNISFLSDKEIKITQVDHREYLYFFKNTIEINNMNGLQFESNKGKILSLFESGDLIIFVGNKPLVKSKCLNIKLPKYYFNKEGNKK